METAALCSSSSMAAAAFSVGPRQISLPYDNRFQANAKSRMLHFKKSSSVLPTLRAQSHQLTITQCRPRRLDTSFVCAAIVGARCAAEQTQTVTRQSSTITIAPIQGKEKSPDLDDGGTGFPPRDDDGDGGGGGGGGGPQWSGGFFFFGLLAFLGFLKDKESEGPYKNERRR